MIQTRSFFLKIKNNLYHLAPNLSIHIQFKYIIKDKNNLQLRNKYDLESITRVLTQPISVIKIAIFVSNKKEISLDTI